MQVMVTRTGDRNPRYARGKPHQEIQSEILTCGLQSSHTETDDQKIPIVLNDYRDFLVSQLQTKSNANFSLFTTTHHQKKPMLSREKKKYCRLITKKSRPVGQISLRDRSVL